MKRFYFALFVLIAFSYSCKKGKELKTENGFKYILYNETSGPKAKVGDYITMVMVYKNDNDSVLFDSRVNGNPIRFRLEKIPFKGSFEDGLTNLAANDSATFFVPADSLYNYFFNKRGEDAQPQSQTAFIPKTFLKFDIKLLKIQTPAEAEEEMMVQMSEREKKERLEISQYIDKKKIAVSPDSAGYYLIINETGSGETIDSGKVVTIEYAGKFLNDSVFDGTAFSGQPYRFIFGAHHVIKGWEMAIKGLHGGDKITLVLPSRLAYGEEGIHDPKRGVFIVEPFTPLAFDIRILSVEDAPAVSRRN